MAGRGIIAGALAAALGVALVAGAAAAQGPGGHTRDGGHGWGGGHGGAGGSRAMGPALDFDAVAGEHDAVDRAALEAYGVERLAEHDLDGDGMLDREELAAALPEPGALMVFAPDRSGERVDRVLAMFGAEDEGAVAVEAVVRRQVDTLFARLDRDGDGTITREEAERPMERRASRAERRGERRSE